jgi:hypothetical protein
MPMINLGWMKCLQQDPCKVSTRKVRVREKLNDSARHNNYMYDYDSIDWIERSRLQLAPVQTNSSQSTMPLKFSIFQRFAMPEQASYRKLRLSSVVCEVCFFGLFLERLVRTVSACVSVDGLILLRSNKAVSTRHSPSVL